jgi:hypothetical protein
LAVLGILVKDIKQNTMLAKKEIGKASEAFDIADDEYFDADCDLDDALVALDEAKEAFRAAGGILPGDLPAQPKVESNVETSVETQKIKNSNEKNPWKTGSFYLVSAIVIIITLAVISINLPWYAVGIVLIGGILTLSVIAALQLRTDESLSEENFLKLMIETFKRLPLLKSEKSSKLDENIVQEKQ